MSLHRATWFVYDYCRDAAVMRRFYGDLIGLSVVWDEPGDVAFLHDGLQLSLTAFPDVPVREGWAFQPGWGHGQLEGAPAGAPVRSMSIALGPHQFREAVARLSAAGVTRLRAEPFWVGYWSFVVRDPDGTTVELSDPTSPGPGGGAAGSS